MKIDNTAASIKSIAQSYCVSPKKLNRVYKDVVSGFNDWNQLSHAEQYVLYKENLGPRLSIDETCLSQGEVYTILTNKDGHGKSGSLVAIVKGTKSESVISALNRMPRGKRLKVEEITMDLSPSMMLIARRCFPNARQVNDRFHVQKLMSEAVSSLRTDYRWQVLEEENAEIALCREEGRKFVPNVLRNGDTHRQLLARSRHILLKNRSKWTKSQKERAEVLFEYYPYLEQAYNLSMELTGIYNSSKTPEGALSKLAKWYDKLEKHECKYFNKVIETMQNHYLTIVEYFRNRATNASAESFNAKVKLFRSQFRGVSDIPFFIFRLTKLFA